MSPPLRGLAAAPIWVHARGQLSLELPRVMAVVNLTPDSFFDGGNLLAPGADDPNAGMAARLCRGLVQQGADLLDLGGESTRPGSTPVDAAIELANQITRNAPLAVQASKRLIYQAAEVSDWESEAWALSDEAARQIMRTADAKEGPRSFAEKRKPKWAGC